MCQSLFFLELLALWVCPEILCWKKLTQTLLLLFSKELKWKGKKRKMKCWLYGSPRWEQKKDDFYELMFLQPNWSIWNSNTCQIGQVLHGITWRHYNYWFLNLDSLSFFIPRNTLSFVKFTVISVGRKWHRKYKKITQEKCSKSIFQRIVYIHKTAHVSGFSVESWL